jgi:hypothetical protein
MMGDTSARESVTQGSRRQEQTSYTIPVKHVNANLRDGHVTACQRVVEFKAWHKRSAQQGSSR